MNYAFFIWFPPLNCSLNTRRYRIFHFYWSDSTWKCCYHNRTHSHTRRRCCLSHHLRRKRACRARARFGCSKIKRSTLESLRESYLRTHSSLEPVTILFTNTLRCVMFLRVCVCVHNVYVFTQRNSKFQTCSSSSSEYPLCQCRRN